MKPKDETLQEPDGSPEERLEHHQHGGGFGSDHFPFKDGRDL